MKIGELVKILKGMDQDERIMLSCDPEGNHYSDIGIVNKEINDDGYVTTIYPED